MSATFIAATGKDAPVIAQLAHKIWHKHYPGIITAEQIDYMLSNRYSAKMIEQQMVEGEKYFLAYNDKEPVAYASIELKDNFYYLHKFYVDVAKHRGGIGTNFFHYLLTQMDASKPVRLQVNRQNVKAVNFYFKMGFVIENAADFDIGGGYYMNDFVMVRKPQ